MPRARDDFYDHYYPLHPSKRLRERGQTSGDIERNDSYRPYQSSKSDSYSAFPQTAREHWNSGSTMSNPTTQNTKRHWNSGSAISNLPTQNSYSYEKSGDYVHRDRKQNLIENTNPYNLNEKAPHVSKTANSKNECKGKNKASENSSRQSQEKKSKSSDKLKARTLHERKNNPSTRIYGLRKQLAGTNLPPNIRIEKERELASLLFDQQKEKVARNTQRMISRYHQVRFFERKRAKKRLNKAIKERDAYIEADHVKTSDGVKESGGPEKLRQMEQQVRDARIDLNYTIYAPLTEKYIGLFADDTGDRRAQIKQERNESVTKTMLEDDKSMLTTQQKHDLQNHVQKDESRTKQQDQAQILRLADRSARPPMWFEVEKIMYPPRPSTSISNKTGEMTDLDKPQKEDPLNKEIIKQLSLLREGHLTTHKQHVSRDKELKLMHGPSKKTVSERADRKSKGKERINGGQKRKRGAHNDEDDDDNDKDGAERKPWMNEDEGVDPMYLDSESADGDVLDGSGGMRLVPGNQSGSDNESETESDGDGGFFERPMTNRYIARS